MSGYVTLLGAEDVASAGSAMRSAAEEMQRAANTIDTAVSRLTQSLDENTQRMQQIADEFFERTLAITAKSST